MLNVITDCCEVLLRRNDDFWTTAALTGCSYETNGPEFCRVIRSLGEFGLPAGLSSQLLVGVNGTMAAFVKERHPDLEPFTPNQKWQEIRPDLHFGPLDTTDETVAEVKGLHDLTTLKFYGGGGHSHSVLNDRKKLVEIRGGGFRGHLFQIVFFLQLPAFERPAGLWTRTNTRAESWRSFRAKGKSGIESQFRHLRSFLIDEPIHGPVVHRLTTLGTEMLRCMSRRYSEGYKPDDAGWTFSPEHHLDDAAVAYAIWRY